MQFFRDAPINTKLKLVFAALGFLTVVPLTMGFVWNDIRMIETFMLRHHTALAETVGANCATALIFDDSLVAGEVLASLRGEPSIEEASVYRSGEGTFAEFRSETAPEGSVADRVTDNHWFIGKSHVKIEKPIIHNEEVVGTIVLWVNMSELRRQISTYGMIVASVLVVTVVVAFLLFGLLQRLIAAPILRLAEATSQVSKQADYTVRVLKPGNDELGVLCDGFNDMLNEIQDRDTSLREAVQQLEIARQQAEGANRSKSEFLANVSHEIRTPLTSILGFAEVLMESSDEIDRSKRDEFLKTIHVSGQHLLNLINDILDLSKVEAGEMFFETVACSPHQIIEEVISILRPRAVEKRLSLEFEWLSGMPESIQTDPERLRQVLTNLIGNAVKFTESGHVQVTARLIDTTEPSRLVIEVIDSGIGIPTDQLENIFDPFVQADNSVTRKFGGTGLGLAICRRIAAGIGGQLGVQSQPGLGSKFTLTLDAGALEDVGIIEQMTIASLKKPGPQAQEIFQSLPPARILLVEDGLTNRELISHILRYAGAEVMIAENGRIGIELAKTFDFDLVLMDMQMPVMDGYTAARSLREQNFEFPIIALTAHAMTGDEEKCRAAGCSGYLSKPVDTKQLVQTVGQLLRAACPQLFVENP